MTPKLFYILLPFFLLVNCSSEPNDDPIPYVPFTEIIVNLNLPEYFNLHADNTYEYIDGGVKGLILYRLNANTFYAFERNCSFRPQEACATVEVHSSQLYMEDTCCGSTFNFSGEPQGGPAFRPLRKYMTRIAGNEVIITDEIVE